MLGETFVQALIAAFFTVLFTFGNVQQGILGTRPCKPAVHGRPSVAALDDALLSERWYLRMWATGNRRLCVRKFIWARAFLMA
jgi:hypothetical protein